MSKLNKTEERKKTNAPQIRTSEFYVKNKWGIIIKSRGNKNTYKPNECNMNLNDILHAN